MEIPIFFFRDLDLENDITFNLGSTYTYSKTEAALSGEIEFGDPTLKTHDIKIKPDIKYHFSNFLREL